MEIVNVLIVEDDPADAELTRLSLIESKIHLHIDLVEDGFLAMAFLRKEGPYQDAVAPDIIFLDRYLPKKDGVEVLQEIKADDRLKDIPVFMLSGSPGNDVQEMSSHLRPVCCLRKPIDFDDISTVVQRLPDFWFSIVKLPR